MMNELENRLDLVQPETLGNGFLFADFLVQSLTSDPSQVFRFHIYLTKLTFWASKSGFSYPDQSCVGIRDFQSKSG